MAILCIFSFLGSLDAVFLAMPVQTIFIGLFGLSYYGIQDSDLFSCISKYMKIHTFFPQIVSSNDYFHGCAEISELIYPRFFLFLPIPVLFSGLI